MIHLVAGQFGSWLNNMNNLRLFFVNPNEKKTSEEDTEEPRPLEKWTGPGALYVERTF